MQTDSVEKVAGVGAIGLWAAMHGWLGWLVVFISGILTAVHVLKLCLRSAGVGIRQGTAPRHWPMPSWASLGASGNMESVISSNESNLLMTA